MLHSRKNKKIYSQLKKQDTLSGNCPFCRDMTLHERVVKRTDTMFVVPNRTQYDVFEGLRVQDHLMVIPRRHVETIAEFTPKEKLEMVDIIGDYEKDGYNIYARGVGSINRSVKHQHTHLIKSRNIKAKFILYLQRPYLLINR